MSGIASGVARDVARDDDGQVGGVEALVFGVLIFVFGTLVIANAWAVIDAKMAVTGAAREAARTFVEAPDEAGAAELATVAARESLTAGGRDPARMAITFSGAFARCSPILVSVSYRLPLVAVPILGGFGAGFTVSARHAEVVDPYRSGPAGVAAC